MLSLLCGGTTSRRSFLQTGMIGLAGLSLPEMWASRAQGAGAGRLTKDTSVVLLFLTGGPSQIESFDPKMSAPAEYRSVTGEVATTIPGVTFGSTFAKLACQAHRTAVVRSFSHAISDHTKAAQHVIRGANPAEAGMGAVVARLRGTGHPRTSTPTHIHLNVEETDTQFHKEKLRLLTADGPGDLGGLYTPFQPGGDSQANRNLKLNIPASQLEDRRALKRAFDNLSRKVDSHGAMSAMDKLERQAFELLLGKARAAFDLSRVDRRLLDRYDTDRFQTGIKQKRASTLGRQLLLARRLCEAGCGFVTIHNPGWDMHGGDTQFNMKDGMAELGRPVDHAVSAFIEDVNQRGLADKILLVITGEFGRTPKVNNKGGRDHWPKLSTLLLAGGGLQMGKTVGQSTSRAEAPRSRPIGPEHLMATILHVLFDLPALRTVTGLPRSVAAIIDRTEPISELI